MTQINPTLLIGLHSTRQSGKDTLCARMRQLDPRVTRFAFADDLKADLAPFVRWHFNLDIWNCSSAQKELVRPLMIAYGCAQREVDVDYWVKRVVEQVRAQLAKTPDVIPTITDVRFPSEAVGLQREFGAAFRLVNLTREGAPPPTDEEEKHFRQVAAMAHVHVHWGNDSEQEQLDHARKLLEWVGAKVGP